MNNYKFYRKKYVLGDIHGYWSVILQHLNHVDETETCYIQVGDFGIGFDDLEKEVDKLLRLNARLVEYNSDLFIIRGNHDNPMWFNEGDFKDIKEQLTNIFFVPDYTVLNLDGENILFIGGAVSIDRVPRRMDGPGRSWWSDEVVKFDFEKVKDFRDIDRVICHTAPDFCQPLKFNQLVYNFASQDDNLLEDLRNERANMTKMITEIMNNNKIKSFVYGHFHNTYRFYHNNCEFLGLNINQFMQF
jgi:UDP-2,3-diacylglucosamine pyrophosphatase LpxH